MSKEEKCKKHCYIVTEVDDNNRIHKECLNCEKQIVQE